MVNPEWLEKSVNLKHHVGNACLWLQPTGFAGCLVFSTVSKYFNAPAPQHPGNGAEFSTTGQWVGALQAAPVSSTAATGRQAVGRGSLEAPTDVAQLCLTAQTGHWSTQPPMKGNALERDQRETQTHFFPTKKWSLLLLYWTVTDNTHISLVSVVQVDHSCRNHARHWFCCLLFLVLGSL